jgi:hypothetical protein
MSEPKKKPGVAFWATVVVVVVAVLLARPPGRRTTKRENSKAQATEITRESRSNCSGTLNAGTSPQTTVMDDQLFSGCNNA